MTALQLFWLTLGATWSTIEVVIALKTRVKFSINNPVEFRSERLIWLVVVTALGLALWIKQMHWLALPLPLYYRQTAALLLVLSGLLLRCYAVFSLGELFSTTVMTRPEHTLIESGPYRFIRHPAYTGLFLSFFGAGVAMGDMLALCILMCPVTYVLTQRIRTEEQWLTEHFGKDYANYSRRTKKLLPWIY